MRVELKVFVEVEVDEGTQIDYLSIEGMNLAKVVDCITRKEYEIKEWETQDAEKLEDY